METGQHDPTSKATLAQEEGEHGRIGYGRWARLSPLGLGLGLLVVVLVIALRDPGAEPTGASRLVGRPAPDVALTTFSGNSVRLGDLRGAVVVVNFWAEWCEPCKEEMPAFQRVAADAVARGEQTVVLGVGIKLDDAEKARAFAASLGITYPVGQDGGGADPKYGPIQQAFGVDPNYPTTIVIRPDGVVDAVRIGPMEEAEMRERIAEARA